jgi:acetyl-CoA C-acetyltransferase
LQLFEEPLVSVSIVGWSHLPFGRLDGLSLEDLITRAAREAIAHAGLDAGAVDALWLGNLNGGFTPDVFASSLALQADDALRWKPATRLENACASGSAAVYAACDAIEAGRARVALVIGAEKMTAVSGADTTRILGQCGYSAEVDAPAGGFPGIFATLAQAYFARHGDHSPTLARIAAKNHANGVANPWAHMRRDLGFEFCNTVSEKNPLIAAPLRKTDCSLVSDGAAALVLVDDTLAADFARAVSIRARAQVNDYLPLARRDTVSFEGPRRAWQQALDAARCGVHDLSLAEVHDCFTIAELLSYEAMGLAPTGQGHRLLEEGVVMRGGRLPVNASGGLKAKGHPIGATGVSMHVVSAMQLCDEAGDLQVPGATLAGVFNMGGAAVASYVSILERTR